MQTWSITDPGCVRSQNQDAFKIEELDRSTMLCVVCDGMGGAKSGNVASSLAVDVFAGEIRNSYNSGMSHELIAEMLRRGFVPFDWNISSLDASTVKLLPAETIVNNVVSRAKNQPYGIVLMHDSAAKTTTAKAVGPMIDQLREMGFELKALTPDTKSMLFAYGK